MVQVSWVSLYLLFVCEASRLCSYLQSKKFGCKCNLKTDSGESREINHPSYVPFKGKRYGNFESSHVFVWYSSFAIGEEAFTRFYKLVTEASFDFHLLDCRDRTNESNVEMCGICLLSAQDAEKLKFDRKRKLCA